MINSTLRIASWNINSLRLRVNNIEKLHSEFAPDIICLQETKVENALFPLDALKNFYPHIVYEGEKSYNGVAILSRIPFQKVFFKEFDSIKHARHVGVEIEGNITLHNFYVPAGGDIPDTTINAKFAHKLRFLDNMLLYFGDPAFAKEKIIIAGDLNIAPFEHDVWSHKQLLKEVSHSPIEIDYMERLQKTQNWIDCGRYFTPLHEKLYSWWSYRNQNWEKSNRGRRLDHIWVTPQLKEHLQSYHTLKDYRNGILPSDHVPIMIDFEN